MQSGITTGQAAEYLGCSSATLRRWRRGLFGPRFFRAGRLIRYRYQDLDKWIAAHSEPPDGSPDNQDRQIEAERIATR